MFLNFRGAAVHAAYYLSKYDPNALRFFLTTTFPETRNTEPALPVPSQFEGRAPMCAKIDDLEPGHAPWLSPCAG